MTRLAFLLLLLAGAFASWQPQRAVAQDRLVVFAAASLKTALDEVAEAWRQETNGEVAVSYAATSALAKQIRQGAPADIFISADMDWMNELAKDALVKQESVTPLLGNQLVLVAPAGSAASVSLAKGVDLLPVLGGGKLAMAEVKAVPAGKYGKAALEWLGIWAAVEPQVAMAENARAALKLVALGEAPLGIVYASDAKAEPAVKLLATFPPGSHPEIIYPAAVVATSTNAAAPAFMDFLRSDKARAIFEQQGFTMIARPASN